MKRVRSIVSHNVTHLLRRVDILICQPLRLFMRSHGIVQVRISMHKRARIAVKLATFVHSFVWPGKPLHTICRNISGESVDLYFSTFCRCSGLREKKHLQKELGCFCRSVLLYFL